MALAKSNTAITQLTATGQSGSIDVSDAYRATAYIKHVNGTGVTAAGEIQIQVRPDGSSDWYDYGGPLETSESDSEEQDWVAELPDDAGDVRLDYTAPSGSSGHTLDMEVGEITSL